MLTFCDCPNELLPDAPPPPPLTLPSGVCEPNNELKSLVMLPLRQSCVNEAAAFTLEKSPLLVVVLIDGANRPIKLSCSKSDVESSAGDVGCEALVVDGGSGCVALSAGATFFSNAAINCAASSALLPPSASDVEELLRMPPSALLSLVGVVSLRKCRGVCCCDCCWPSDEAPFCVCASACAKSVSKRLALVGSLLAALVVVDAPACC